MAEFFAQLKRRHVYRVAAAYAVVAWLLIQLINNVAPVLDLPVWVARTFLLALIVGFPITLIMAWTREPAPADGAGRATTGKLDWILIGALLAVLALVSYQQLSMRTVTPETVAAARSAAASPQGAISLAVLPFVNLSSDKEQEFFSDGMTEEITSALARVPDLRVVGRTSAFQFKGDNKDLRAIGQALSATHLIEGSVRKAGNRVRITAQLIKAEDGTHIWAQDYDRELTDVFAIQEDIARAITASLNMSLGLRPGENLVNNRNIDPESHEKLLRAKAIYDGRGGRQDAAADAESEALLHDVLAKNPNFAPAWGLLGGVYLNLANRHAANADEPIAESRAQVNEIRAKGEAAAQRAIQADPNLTNGYAALAVFVWSRAKPLEAEEIYLKALALDAADAYLLDGYTIRMGAAGRVKDALASIEKARILEPFLPAITQRTVDELWLNGQNDAAIARAKTLPNGAQSLARIYASMGRYREAADALMEIASDPNSPAGQAVRLLRTAPTKSQSPESLPRLPAGFEYVYLHVGAPERAIATYERRAEVGFLGTNTPSFVWHPSYAPVRKTERFKALMRKVGLVDYWRAKGWPEQCKPTTGDDFECS